MIKALQIDLKTAEDLQIEFSSPGANNTEYWNRVNNLKLAIAWLESKIPEEKQMLEKYFDAGKHLGFGEAHRRPGNYNSFEDYCNLIAENTNIKDK